MVYKNAKVKGLSLFDLLALSFATLIAGRPATHATPFPNGLRCGESQGALGDILPEEDGKPGTWVVAIDKMIYGKRTVGFVYVMHSGRSLMQATSAMPQRIRDEMQTAALHVQALPKRLPSSISIIPCPRDELTKRIHHI